MKFSTDLVLACLAVGVLAGPTPAGREPPTLVERDLATVTSVIAQVDSGIKNLDSVVKAFTGDPSQMLAASTSLLSTIKSGTAAVQASTPLTLGESLALQSTVTGLQGNGQALVSDLTAQKPAFEKAGLCAGVRKQVQDISAGSKALIAAVVAKVPTAAQPIAAELAKGVTQTLEQGEATFAEGSCVDAAAPGGGSGSPGATSAPASPSDSAPVSTPAASSPAASSPAAVSSSAAQSTITAPASTGSGAATPTTGTVRSATSSVVQFTGAAAVNSVAGPIGGLVLAAAALLF